MLIAANHDIALFDSALRDGFDNRTLSRSGNAVQEVNLVVLDVVRKGRYVVEIGHLNTHRFSLSSNNG